MPSYRGLPERSATILCCFDNFALCFDNIVLCFGILTLCCVSIILCCFDNFVLCLDNFMLCFDNFVLCFTNIDLCFQNKVLFQALFVVFTDMGHRTCSFRFILKSFLSSKSTVVCISFPVIPAICSHMPNNSKARTSGLAASSHARNRTLPDLGSRLCLICSYDVTGADFQNSPYAFDRSEKR